MVSAETSVAAGDGVRQGVARQGQADDHSHRAGDGGGQDGLHHFLAEELDEQARGNGDQPRADDAELGVLDGLRGQDAVHFLKALGSAHAGDGGEVGEAGAVVQRDLPPGDQDKAQGGQAAGENGGRHLEAGDQGHGDRGGEHDDHLLDGVEDELDKARALFRQVTYCGVFVCVHWFEISFPSDREKRDRSPSRPFCLSIV